MAVRICLFVFFLSLLGSCSSSTSEADNKVEEKPVVSAAGNENIFQDDFNKEKELYDQVFPWILDSTFYKNPRLLIEQLGIIYNQDNPAQTTIVHFEQQQLHGLTDSVWFINCSTVLSVDSSCAYPSTHTQYLFNHQGKLIHKGTAAVAQFVPHMIDSLPIYMNIQHDCTGNGQHHFYSYQQGKLIDIFNVLMDDNLKTYDANPEKGMFRNKHLKVIIQDSNKDGYNDILLKGKWLVLENKYGKKTHYTRPFKAEKVAYHFLYKPTKEYFLLEPSITSKQ